MKASIALVGIVALALPAAAEERKPAAGKAPAAAGRDLEKAAAAVEAAARGVSSLRGEYIWRYLPYGRAVELQERGTLSWKRTADGKSFARWEGVDEEQGAVLSIVRDRELAVWKNGKLAMKGSLDAVNERHASRFGFPGIPADWRTAYVLGGPEHVSGYIAGTPKYYAGGMPSGLSFWPKEKERTGLKRVSVQVEEKTGLPYKFECETFAWQHYWIDMGEWTINPELPDTLFEPPAPGAPPAAKPAKPAKP